MFNMSYHDSTIIILLSYIIKSESSSSIPLGVSGLKMTLKIKKKVIRDSPTTTIRNG